MFARTLNVVVFAVSGFAFALSLQAQTRLLRFPDTYGDQVVFTYAGDLWIASSAGGAARRLTTHPGLELFGKFSPDGQWIAFTGQYDGDEQVYVIPTAGGIPQQLTYYPALGPLPPRWGYDNQVYGWTPDGGAVLFRSLRDGWDLTGGRLYTVDVAGGLPEALPMPESGAGDFSPDGQRIVYSPLFRDFRHWKRYQGGWAQDLFIFELDTHGMERITDHIRSDRDPMWIGDKIYFSSDRTGKLNLFAYDIATQAIEQLTNEELWDIRWPSADPVAGRIVYELNGQLVLYDIEAGVSTPVEIRVPTDAVAMRPGRVDASKQIEDFGLSPKGERAVFAARGDIFTAPIEKGPTRNLTRSSGAHDRDPVWLPDGKRIAFISDLDGEEEIYLVEQNGRGQPRQLTDGNAARLEDLEFSPDGRWIAFHDQAAKLYVVDTASGEQLEIADDRTRSGLDYAFSPDGGWLAFSLAEESGFRSLHIWSADSPEIHKITSELSNDFGPTWDPAGDYLFFVSDREYAPQIGSIEFNYVVDRESYIYALALRKDVEHPFPPESDEVTLDEKNGEAEGESDGSGTKAKGKKGKKENAKDEDKEKAKEPIRIDFDGLAERVARVPLPAENYFGIAAIEGHLLVAEGFPFYYGRQSHREAELKIFSMEDREASSLVAGFQGLSLSSDGSKVIIRKNGTYQVLDAKKGGGEKPKTVSTAGLQVDRIPQEEWAQIFHEVWRRFRDFFYVENMHGYDWQALREQYSAWLPHVGHRSDLNYVISEMVAELNVSHTYITGGDYEIPERPKAALLGARFELDPEVGRYRISKIFSGQNAEDRYRSPLTEVGVNVSVGDYVLQINGVELEASENPYRILRHAGGTAVELAVNAKPQSEGIRHVTVEAIDEEDDLIYLGWVEENRRRVEAATGGRVGYMHLPDMSSAGIREWIKWYYPQIRKQGLIIDVRNNGGGNVSSMIIERLSRKLLAVDFERNLELSDPYPDAVFHGHLVCLLDEDTASDGDQFAYAFREAGLGPLIGKRSWGGVVGYYGGGRLIDGGGLAVPESGSASAADGRWVMEGHGVEPDIEVNNEPRELLAGRDQQLEKAIEVILARIETEPKRYPDRPADPIKTE